MFGLRKNLLAMLLAFIALTVPSAKAATVLFSDTFQGDLSQWQTNGSGVIVPDPLVPGGNALAFSALGSGGDLFSPVIAGTGAGTFTLGFYVLAGCNQSSDCGAFFGIQQQIGGEHWIAADTPYPGLVDLFADTPAWQWVVFSFTADSPFQIKFEDFSGSPNAYPYTVANGASVYFKDLQLYDGAVSPPGPILGAVPEPASFTLVGFGLAGLGMIRRHVRGSIR